jgi:hypothetical protein
MSDSEEHSVEEIIPMPKNRVRFTDMPLDLQEKAIRSKSLWFNSSAFPNEGTAFSLRCRR